MRQLVRNPLHMRPEKVPYLEGKENELVLSMDTRRNPVALKKSLGLLGMLQPINQCFTSNADSCVVGRLHLQTHFLCYTVFFSYHIWLKYHLIPWPRLSPPLFPHVHYKGPTSDINLKLPWFFKVSYSLTEPKLLVGSKSNPFTLPIGSEELL